jgi:nucleoside-diphosphate-sugar epimerase
LPEQSYDDLDGIDKVTSVPDSAWHRDVDKIVLDYAAQDPEAVKVAIVCPPTIYGPGRGTVNQASQQIPGLIATTLKEGFGPIIGAGGTEWDNVHVQDLSALILLLAAQSTLPEKNRAENEIWGPRGYHFAENGTHKWSAIAEVIAKEAHKQGLIQSSEAKQLDVEVAKEKYARELFSWAFNSKGKAKRARKYLGWQPSHPSLEETIPQAVRFEAQRQNKGA